MNTLTKIENESGLTIMSACNGVMDSGRKLTATKWLAGKFGVAITKGLTRKDVKAAIIAKHTEAAFKAAVKEYDAGSREFFRASRIATAIASSDPDYRQSVRFSVGKDGIPTGNMTTSFVRTSGANNGPSLREQQLENELNALRAEMAAAKQLTA